MEERFEKIVLMIILASVITACMPKLPIVETKTDVVNTTAQGMFNDFVTAGSSQDEQVKKYYRKTIFISKFLSILHILIVEFRLMRRKLMLVKLKSVHMLSLRESLIPCHMTWLKEVAPCRSMLWTSTSKIGREGLA